MATTLPLYKRAAFMLSAKLNQSMQELTLKPAAAAMDPTTLVTFLFRAPPEARTVELLGSWDNFTQPYRMNLDRRRGAGSWTGCFKFDNIIFDGDSSKWTKPRNGGLKQGGTYWYYYRLDDEIEAYDHAQARTTSCPLLPGQTLNILEVPIEFIEPPARCRSASVDAMETLERQSSTHTLDPGSKFNALEPPPVSKVHIRCVSDLALNGRLESKPHPSQPAAVLPSPTHSPPTSSHVEHVPTILDKTKPTRRYYADVSYDDGRSSLYSRRSWHSEGPSFTHSSILDAYDSDSIEADEQESILCAFPGVPRPVSRPATIPEDENIDHFDFGLPSDKDNCNTAPDSSYSDCGPTDFELQNDPTADEVDSLYGDDVDASSYGPPSVHDVQLYGSCPTTSHGTEQPWRQRVYTVPSPELRNHEVGDSDTAHYEAPSVPIDQSDEQLQYSVTTQQARQPSSQADSTAEDIWSPTFSAATVSSGGVNTPFRLSIGYSRASNNHDDSLEGVAERLRSLDSVDSEPELPSPIIEGDESMFTGYALPQSDAVLSVQSLGKLSSEQSLGKLSSAHASVAHDLPLPTLMPEMQERSFADSIFSELGYLGRSIA